MAKITAGNMLPAYRRQLIVVALAAIVLGAGPDTPPELVDGKAIDAFKQYWSAFDEHEEKLTKDGIQKFKQSWDDVKSLYQEKKAKIGTEELEALQRAADKYKEHLEQHTDADNRPFVMMNLAQIQNLIGDHLAKQDANAGTFAKSEALALLKDIEDKYPTFAYREQAFYLRAIVLESLDRQDEALAAWQALSATSRSTLYGVHARVALGDHLFMRERAADAMKAYEKALELLPDVQADDPEYERLRINYRLAWAAYRAAELNTVIKAGAELLIPGRRAKTVEQREKIQQDGVDMMGDALYEANNFSRAKEVLNRRELLDFAAGIGLRALTRYAANGIHSEAVVLGEWLINQFPLAKEAPDTLALTADSWAKLDKTSKRIAALEKLSLLLPAQSLWRSHHKGDLTATKKMEERAVPAAVAVATYYYDAALGSGNVKTYETASSFYDLLLEHSANAADANDWRLRRAHCQYFAGNYEDASRQYNELKSSFKVDAETLQVSSYQLVLTNERRWRELFGKSSEQGIDPTKGTGDVAKALESLEKSIDEFAARFPAQTRAVDLLLVGASANRDMNLFDKASRYWQRALVSTPSPAQRGVAIRGLIFATMKTGSTGDVVEATRRFLKLEDWRSLGLALSNELRGVLSAAALDEGRRLNGTGNVLEAGKLLTDVAAEFGDVPDRDKIWRDGAYMLAIAGDWAGAQKAAEGYAQSGLGKNKGDMVYLLARSHEYQLRLHEAAKHYFELGRRFAGHSRADTSLQRAEKLAVAEGDFSLAAEVATTLGERAKKPEDRIDHFERAVTYLDKGDNAAKALNLARKRLRSSTTITEKLKSQLLVARMNYKAGGEQEALDDLAILAKTVERQRQVLKLEDYQALTGEIQLLLGDEAKRRFDDFNLIERQGDLSGKVAQKSRYFEDLVQAYDRAAASGHPRWSAQARFELATAAESFADEIASVPTKIGEKSGEGITLKSRNRFNATIERLGALAKKYHSSNVLAARKDPARFKDNEWIKKSTLRLTGDISDKPETRHKQVLPTSLQDNLPSEWSL